MRLRWGGWAFLVEGQEVGGARARSSGGPMATGQAQLLLWAHGEPPGRGGGGLSWEQYNPTVQTSLDLRSRAQTAGEVGREEAEMAPSIQRLLRGGDHVGRGSTDGRTLESLPFY